MEFGSAPEGRVILFIIPNEMYRQSILQLVSAMTKKFKNLCFITLNRPHYALVDDFKKMNIDIKRLFFIDAVTKKTTENIKVLLVSSPRAFLELNTGIEEIIVGSGADCFIFDSLSTLLLYGDSLGVARMVHMMAMKIRSEKLHGVFTCLEKDISSSLVSDISMFSDEVIYAGRGKYV